MFFGGKNLDAGICVNPLLQKSRRHTAQGYEFTLPFEDGPEAPNTQANWFRNCMVFIAVGGVAGTCAKDRAPHRSTTRSFNFHLPHDIPEAPGTQRDWRFCRKCHVLYFGGHTGPCVLGGMHEQDKSFDFVLNLGGEFRPKQYAL
jgi:hypothetical protein